MTCNEQRWDPDRYQRNAGFVAELGAPLIELLALQAGERVLDLGCGDGRLTEKLVDLGATVVGVDASAEQVAAAIARGLDARVADGAALDFVEEFDAVLSNAALHWMTRPDAVVAGVWKALKPGGRFVGEMGGAGNVARVRGTLLEALARRGLDGAAADPWFFPSVEDYAGRLEAAGFEVAEIALIDRPTELPGRLGDWLETFAGPFLFLVPAAARPKLIAEVEDALAETLRGPDGRWVVDYVRLRFRALKPPQ